MNNEAISNRYDFTILFDVENGNPNGDPDFDNMPRVDLQTNLGLVTDVCIKRKIRNYIDIIKEDEKGYKIYIKNDDVLNNKDEWAYKELNLELKDTKKIQANDLQVKDFMCQNYFDIRTFGAVMTKHVDNSLNAGQVRGPIQFGFGKSIDPIFSQEITITRKAITTVKRAEKSKTEIGRKHIVPYGLYRMEGFISANLAKKVTGFSEGDLKLFWEAVINMFEHDRSAARGKMAMRKLIVFKHESEFGNAPSHKLTERIKVRKLNDDMECPRSFEDYVVEINIDNMPNGVEILINDESGSPNIVPYI